MIRIFNKIRQNGFNWFLSRLRREFRSPTRPFAKHAIDAFLKSKRNLRRFFITPDESRQVFAIYDLAICPITYNFVEFLIDAEYEARKGNKDGFIVVFVPPEEMSDPSLRWAEYDAVIDSTSKQWRFQNILIPLTFLSAHCKGFRLLENRAAVKPLIQSHDVYPHLYDGVNLRTIDMVDFMRKISSPDMFDGLSAHPQGLKYIESWQQARGLIGKIVTITIRSHGFDTVRNSNIDAWAEFARYLVSRGYNPVVIPDTDTAFQFDPRFDEAMFFRECAWNIGLRMALYESAYLNLFVANGCAVLAFFNHKCRYVCLSGPPRGIVNTEEAYKHMNRGEGTDSPWVGAYQRTSVKSDSFANIVEEFEQMDRMIQADCIPDTDFTSMKMQELRI